MKRLTSISSFSTHTFLRGWHNHFLWDNLLHHLYVYLGALRSIFFLKLTIALKGKNIFFSIWFTVPSTTKLLVLFSASNFIVPYVLAWNFSLNIQWYSGAIWDKFALYLVPIYYHEKKNSGIAPSFSSIRDEFSEQHQHQSIKKQHI